MSLKADVTIVGAGPAGLSAAINCAAEGLSTIVLERSKIGGAVRASTSMKNYAGFGDVSGPHFAHLAYVQARSFGARFLRRNAIGLKKTDRGPSILTATGAVESKTIVLALGVTPTTDPILDQHGSVHYAPSPQSLRSLAEEQGPRCTSAVVIGGGNSAGQAAVYLRRFTPCVIILARRPLRSTMSDYLCAEIKAAGVNTIIGTVESCDNGFLIVRLPSGDLGWVECSHVFAYIGAKPRTGWLPSDMCDDEGFVYASMKYQTDIEGVFAIGDCVSGSTKRVATAVGAGSAVARHLWAYLEEIREMDTTHHSTIT